MVSSDIVSYADIPQIPCFGNSDGNYRLGMVLTVEPGVLLIICSLKMISVSQIDCPFQDWLFSDLGMLYQTFMLLARFCWLICRRWFLSVLYCDNVPLLEMMFWRSGQYYHTGYMPADFWDLMLPGFEVGHTTTWRWSLYSVQYTECSLPYPM